MWLVLELLDRKYFNWLEKAVLRDFPQGAMNAAIKKTQEMIIKR